MATSDDLLQDVYAHFLSAFGESPSSSGANFIAFEPMGFSPGYSTGNPNSAALAVENTSTLADSLPDISSGVYVRTMRTISVTYADMLSVSAPSAQTAVPTFNALKASAQESIANSSLGSEQGPTSFVPAYAMPVNWYDPAQSANWSNYSYSVGSPATPPAGGNPVVQRPPIRFLGPVPPWRFTATPVKPATPASGADPRLDRSVLQAAVPTEAPIARPPIDIRPLPVVVANPTPALQPVLKPEFTMSFQYCIVQLNRPWLSGDFLATPGWYVPSVHQGDYASGPAAISNAPASSSGASGSAPASASPAYGPFSFLPVALIAIKNLAMNAAAIEDSSSKGPVTAFGPFSLAQATGSSNALFAPGIQIIGWVCDVQPQLPPDTDPALIPPPAPTGNDPIGGIGTVVNILTGLFGGTSA